MGGVTRPGQEDFHAEPAPLYVLDHDEAVAVARTLLALGRRIFLVKIDSDEWSEVVR